MTNYKTFEKPFTNVMPTYIVNIWDTPIHKSSCGGYLCYEINSNFACSEWLYWHGDCRRSNTHGDSRHSCYVKNLLTSTFFYKRSNSFIGLFNDLYRVHLAFCWTPFRSVAFHIIRYNMECLWINRAQSGTHEKILKHTFLKNIMRQWKVDMEELCTLNLKLYMSLLTFN